MTVELLTAPIWSPEEDSSLRTPVQEALESITATEDIDEQLDRILWIKLDVLGRPQGKYMDTGFYPENDQMVELRERLVHFAVDPKSSPSTLVRVTALESAIALGYGRERLPGRRALNDMRRDGQSQAYGTRETDGWAYRHLSEALLATEGHERTILFPDETEDEIDRRERFDDHNPVVAFEYLSRMQKELHAGHDDPEAERYAPLLDELDRKLAQQAGLPRPLRIELKDWNSIAECDRLLEYGDNYRDVLHGIIEKGKPEDMECIKLLGEMSENAFWAARAYPSRYVKGVERSMKHVLADGLYAVLHHVSNGYRTDEMIPLESGRGLPFKMEGNEHLKNTRKLHFAIEELWGVGYFSMASIKVNEADGYGQYRLVDYGSPLRLTHTTQRLRPRASHTYDERMEFGSPGNGVDASYNLIIDTDESDGGVPQVGKHRGDGDDGRISIRLDREGIRPATADSPARRDSTSPHGRLSLDVGSILGRDDWTSTKIGRMLALGNALRTAATGDRTRLNHVSDYFTDEDGEADVFAAEVAASQSRLESRRLSVDDLARGIVRLTKPVGRLRR